MRRRLVPALLALFAAPATSLAVGLSTQLNCASDYYAYCSQHPVGSPGVRKCMRSNGPRLSKSCINALIADGEISKTEVERTKAKIAGGKAKAKQPKPSVETEQAKAKVRVDKQERAVAKRTPSKAKPEAVAKLTDEDARKTSKPRAVPEPEPKAGTNPSRSQPAVPETAQQPAAASAEPMLTLDQKTYEALKARQANFVLEDALAPAAAVVVQTPPDAATPTSSDREGRDTPAQNTADGSAPQRQSAGIADTSMEEPDTSLSGTTRSIAVESDTPSPSTSAYEPSPVDDPPSSSQPAAPSPRPEGRSHKPAPDQLQAQKKQEYPAGKMALGKSETAAPAVRPVPNQSQAWQEFMSSRFSGGFNLEGMDASFSRRGR